MKGGYKRTWGKQKRNGTIPVMEETQTSYIECEEGKPTKT